MTNADKRMAYWIASISGLVCSFLLGYFLSDAVWFRPIKSSILRLLGEGE
jgi:membrane associated rhomboid family serine protease